jgi:hypothetical protein
MPTRIATAIVREFRSEVEADGARFVCVVIPDGDMMKRGEVRRWQPLLDRIRGEGVVLADPSPELLAMKDDPDLIAPGGHFERTGNEVIAAAVRAEIATR